MFNSQIKAKSILCITIATCLSAIAFQPDVKAQSLSKKLSVLSEIENQDYPRMVGREIRVDSAFAGPGKRFGYNLTLVNYSANQIDGAKFARKLQPMAVKKLCNSSYAGFFREQKVTMEIRIYDKGRSLVGRSKVSPSQCK